MSKTDRPRRPDIQAADAAADTGRDSL